MRAREMCFKCPMAALLEFWHFIGKNYKLLPFETHLTILKPFPLCAISFYLHNNPVKWAGMVIRFSEGETEEQRN